MALTAVDAPRAREILSTATFSPPPFQRQPFGVARDRMGTYYYVDKGSQSDIVDFRVFAGPRGAMEPLAMTNVVHDQTSAIFTTEGGTLRLVLEQPVSYWHEGKNEPIELVNVPLEGSEELIYRELGVYAGQPLGNPCDVF